MLHGHVRRLSEVMICRRRTGGPLETRSLPGIRARDFAELQRPDEVDRRQNEADGQDRSAGAGENVEHLKFRRIRGVAAGEYPLFAGRMWAEEQGKTEETEQHRKGGAAIT